MMNTTQPMTAGQKAAATRARNKAMGIPPKSRPAPAQTWVSTPKATSRDKKLVALAALEDAFVLVLREQGVTDEARKAYAQYTKVKALALGPAASVEAQREANSALRMSLIQAIKLAF